MVSPKSHRRPQSLPVFPGRRHVIVVVSSRAASGVSVACSAFADPVSTAPAVLPAGAPSLPLPLPLPSPARPLPQASSLAEPHQFPQAFSPTGPRRFPPSFRRRRRPPVLLRPIAFRRAHRRPAQPPAAPHSPPFPASRPLALQAQSSVPQSLAPQAWCPAQSLQQSPSPRRRVRLLFLFPFRASS